jgi:ABC-2 type transport system ATP-binding protein
VNPFENPRAMRRTVFVRDNLDATGNDRVGGLLNLHARLRPTWDGAEAARLLGVFGIDRGARVAGPSGAAAPPSAPRAGSPRGRR